MPKTNIGFSFDEDFQLKKGEPVGSNTFELMFYESKYKAKVFSAPSCKYEPQITGIK
jgi:hypothetical protein